MTADRSPADAARRFRGLPKRQHEVFEQVAIGLDAGHPPRTLEALERKGLLQSSEQQIAGPFRGTTMTIKRYEVPLAIHMEWCAWCGAPQKGETGE